MEHITINWHGPYQLSRAHLPEIAEENGIYVITRKWGNSETLIYIGRTKRGLYQRISEHEKSWLCDFRGCLQVRYGVLSLQLGQRFSLQRLADVEALLIVWHKPQENTVNKDYYYGRERLKVANIGRRGPLCVEVSTLDLVDF